MVDSYKAVMGAFMVRPAWAVLAQLAAQAMRVAFFLGLRPMVCSRHYTDFAGKTLAPMATGQTPTLSKVRTELFMAQPVLAD
jgi:hypothetical protein